MIKEISKDIEEISHEAFISSDHLVINWRGLNFYQACDHRVKKHKHGGSSHCVKRKGHPGLRHEDFDGNARGGVAILRFFGWWNPKDEAEEYYTQGWNNGAITSMVLVILVTAALFLLSR